MEKRIIRLWSILCLLLMIHSSFYAQKSIKQKLLVIEEQGSFAIGGTMITNPGTFDPYKPTPEGQTFRGDHAYVFYQIPVKARKYPLVMWHGIGQFSKTWETTADGEKGIRIFFFVETFLFI